jgi:uncharacterized protein (DUF39 family)
LQSGSIELNGKLIKTAPMSSMLKAREIAGLLKEWILQNKFTLSEPVKPFPTNTSLKSLQIR